MAFEGDSGRVEENGVRTEAWDSAEDAQPAQRIGARQKGAERRRNGGRTMEKGSLRVDDGTGYLHA